MDDTTYMLLIIIIAITIMFFGGHNFRKEIEYDTPYFINLRRVKVFEKKIQNINTKINFDNKNYIDISKHINITIIPNLKHAYFINIEQKTLFDVKKLVTDYDTFLMIIFNHNKFSDIELLVNTDGNIGYFYDLYKIISITDVFNIYNNSTTNVILTVFFVFKPFWHA